MSRAVRFPIPEFAENNYILPEIIIYNPLSRRYNMVSKVCREAVFSGHKPENYTV